MPGRLERDIEVEACNKILNELAVFSIRIAKAQERGYPDRIFLLPGGRPLFIEFKRPGQYLTARQQLLHLRLRYFGYAIETIESWEDAFKMVEEALKRS